MSLRKKFFSKFVTFILAVAMTITGLTGFGAGMTTALADADTTVTIGDGTSSSGYISPFNTNYNNSRNDMIYPASKLVAGDIQSISFQINAIKSGGFATDSIQIYLGHYEGSTFSDTTFNNDDLTLVYSSTGESVGSTSGWETFTFNQNGGSFTYNGEDNLRVVVFRKSSGYSTTPTYYYSSAGNDNTVLYRRSDNDATVADMPGSTTGAARSNNLPNTQFAIETCDHPEANLTFKETVAPTCEEKGYDTYHCSKCDKDIKKNEVTALGHSWGEPQLGNKDGSLDPNGKYNVYTCTRDSSHFYTTSAAPTVWDGEESTIWTEGDGTESSPYIIDSAAKLAYLQQQVNAGTAYTGTYFKQTVDLDLADEDWTPIGNSSNNFAGNYDGCGHKIDGLNISTTSSNTGLFGYVNGTASSYASIKGLTISGSVSSSGNPTGGIVGYGTYVNISECANEAAINSTGSATSNANVGGIVGLIMNGSVDACTNHANITAAGYQAGGIVGNIGVGTSPATVTISNCYNTGDISANYYSAGIAGYQTGYTTAKKIENCYNAGTISMTNTGTYANRAAGIVGYLYGSTAAANSTYNNCYFLSGCAPQTTNIYGYLNSQASITNCSAKSDTEMKDASFVETLGEKFISGATYPMLYWEAPEGIPVITAESLADADYKKDTAAADVAALSITATGEAEYGNLVYQWYKATEEDLSDAAAISGATSDTYKPATDMLGTFYYYCTVNNDVQSADGSGPYKVQSGTSAINIWSGTDAVAPTITTQPQDLEVEQLKTTGNELSVTASFAGEDETVSNCVLTYQWQVSDTEDGTFNNIDGATATTYAAPTSTLGTKYYRCVVTNTREKASTASTTSDAAEVTVVGMTISNEKELSDFRDSVNSGNTYEGATITLTEDLDLSTDSEGYTAGNWTLIGTSTNKFKGEFDGGGHTIEGISINNSSLNYAGLFGYVEGSSASAPAIIKGIVAKGTITSTKAGTYNVPAMIGGIAGYTKYTTIENCGNEIALSASATYTYMGGIVGQPDTGTNLIACYNKAAVTFTATSGTAYIGGLIGRMNAAMNVTSCYNTGAVNNSGSSSPYTGGIVGYPYSNSLICDSYNSGTVTYAGTGTGTTATYNGGIMGGGSTGNNYGSDSDPSYVQKGVVARGDYAMSSTVTKTYFQFKSAEEMAAADMVATLNSVHENTWQAGDEIEPAQSSPALSWEKLACEHEWVAGEVTSPTCTEQGYTTYKCSKCEKTKQDDFTDALGHDIEGVEAESINDGTHSFECKRCHENVIENCLYSDTLHDNDDGTHTFICEACGYTKTEDCDFTYDEDGDYSYCACGAKATKTVEGGGYVMTANTGSPSDGDMFIVRNNSSSGGVYQAMNSVYKTGGSYNGLSQTGISYDDDGTITSPEEQTDIEDLIWIYERATENSAYGYLKHKKTGKYIYAQNGLYHFYLGAPPDSISNASSYTKATFAINNTTAYVGTTTTSSNRIMWNSNSRSFYGFPTANSPHATAYLYKVTGGSTTTYEHVKSNKHTYTPLTHHEAKAATCTEAGTIEYWECPICHKLFSNKNGSTEITEISENATGHDYEFKVFTWTEDTENGGYTAAANYECKNDATHTQTVSATVTSETTDAKCEVAGKTVYTATVAEADDLSAQKAERTATKEVTIAAIGHDYEFKGFTWTEDDEVGYTAVANYECKTDPAHKQTVAAEVTSETTAATCESAGNTVYTATVAEDKDLAKEKEARTATKEVTIAATGHDYEFTSIEWADDHESAKAVFTCKNDSKHIERVDAVITKVETKPTCTEAGNIRYIAAFVFNGEVKLETTYEDINAAGHTAAAAVKENEKAATCEKAGSYDEVVYCSVCGEEISRETKSIDKLAHKLIATAAKDASCEEDGNTAYWTCSECGKIFFDEAGKTETTLEKTVVKATGHDWDEGEWTWAEDYSTAEVTFTCENDSDHVETVEAEITSNKTDSTCTEEGNIFYVATASFDGKAYTDKNLVAVSAKGHTPAEAVKENEKAATCTEAGSYDEVVYCSVCGAKISRQTKSTDKLAHKLTATAAKAATCEEAGNTAYWTCSDCGKIFSDKDGKTETTLDKTVVKALGHDWDEGKVTTEATCEKAGVKTYTCKNDSKHTRTEEIAATGHTAGEAVIENEKAATTEKEGSYDLAVYCTECDKELSRTTVTVPKLDKAADRDALKEAIADAVAELAAMPVSENGKDIDPEDFWVDADTASALSDTISDAMDVLADGSASQEDIDAAAEKLGKAKKAFDEAAQPGNFTNKTALADAIAAAESDLANTKRSNDGSDVYPDEDWVTEESAADFAAVIASAKEVLDDEDADQGELDAAAETLAAYQEQYFDDEKQAGTKTPDKGVLTSAIEAAKADAEAANVSEDGTDVDPAEAWVSPAVKDALDKAIKAAEDTAAKADATEAEIAEAASALKAAQDMFDAAKLAGTKKDDVDKTDLASALMDAADAMLGTEVSDDGSDVDPADEWVTEADAKALNDAIAEAMTTLSDPAVTQEDADAAADKLAAAKKAFEDAKQAGNRKSEEKPEKVAVTGIKVTPESAVMATKATQQLKVEVTPANATDKSVTYTSSNPDVATVDANGVITAKTYGKATITVTTNDGGKTAKCEVQTRFYDVNGTNVKGAAGYQYYYDAVYWAADKDITRGYDGGEYFGPSRDCTRREMIIFLWRVNGRKPATGTLPFSDIAKYSNKNSDSYKAMLWGYQNGIIKGYGDGTFRPDDSVCRKDSLIMLYRVANKPAVSGKITFPDVLAQKYKPSSDTYKAILWGVQKGITNGYADGNFKPLDNCLREHIVTFIYRYAK